MRAMTVTCDPVHPLPDIHDVAALSTDDAPLMQDLYDVLRKHNALRRFGITLLHQHFELAHDEVLVESTNRQTRTQTIEPIKVCEIKDLDAIETSWRLDTGEPVMSCKCIKYGPNEHQHQERG
jgi:hypothetical protein